MKKHTLFVLLIALILISAVLVGCGKIGVTVTQLDTPSGLTVVDNVLRWNSVSNADQYIVNCDGLDIATVSDFSYQLTGLQDGQTYIYKVKARNGLGLYSESNYSEEFSYTYMSGQTQPTDFETGLPALMTPSGIQVNNGLLTWTNVENANHYIVSINGTEYRANEAQLSIETLANGVYQIKIKAVGDGEKFGSSQFSTLMAVDLYDGSVSETTSFGQFDDLSMYESFLGYGIDIIETSVISDRDVKQSFCIFDTNKLLNLRLIKVNSKTSHVEIIEAETIEEFSKKWNKSLNIDVSKSVSGSGKGNVEGVDVEVQASMAGSIGLAKQYSNESSLSKKNYYYCISIYNQKFYIVMQGDMDTFRGMMTDAFKKDLYDPNVDPGTLFSRYGTHFITSAVMGGRINAYYNMYSESEQTTTVNFKNVSGSITSAFNALVAKVFSIGQETSAAVAYQKTVETSKSTNQVKTLQLADVMGGGDYGIMIVEQVPEIYEQWEKSLDAYPALMGIKDTSSLVGIWELIDINQDTRDDYVWTDSANVTHTGTRAEQLYGYFLSYGLQNYQALRDAASLPKIKTPKSITNVLIGGNAEERDGYYHVNANSQNNISFCVNPGDAMYIHSYSLDSNDYVTIENVVLKVRPANEIDDDAIVRLTITAGNVSYLAKIKIDKVYDVSFDLGLDNTDYYVRTKQNIRAGYRIEEPQNMIKDGDSQGVAIERYGYRLLGWQVYTNGEHKYFDFDVDKVTRDMTLHAKWEKVYIPVTYHYYDGKENDETTIWQGQRLERPKNPTRQHYEFVGWYSDKKCTIAFDFNEPIVEETNLYAKWEAEMLTVEFDSNGGSPIASIDNVVYNSSIVFPNAPTRSGYQFGGWYLDKDAVENEFTQSTKVLDNITLYAKWEDPEIIKYTVQFVTNTDEFWNDEKVNDGSCLNAQYFTPSFKKDGYTFGGWYVDDEFETKFNANDGISSDLTLFAKWNIKTYELKFYGYDGIVFETKLIPFGITLVDALFEEGGDYAISKQPTAEVGKHFVRWHYSTDVMEDGTTAHPVFEVNKHKITANCGESTQEINNVMFGASILQSLENVTKNMKSNGILISGWTIGGVEIKVGEGMPDNDVTCEAIWSNIEGTFDFGEETAIEGWFNYYSINSTHKLSINTCDSTIYESVLDECGIGSVSITLTGVESVSVTITDAEGYNIYVEKDGNSVNFVMSYVDFKTGVNIKLYKGRQKSQFSIHVTGMVEFLEDTLYTLRLNYNGTKYHGTEKEAYYYHERETIMLPSISRSGYVIEKWDGLDINNLSMPAEDTNAKVIWEDITTQTITQTDQIKHTDSSEKSGTAYGTHRHLTFPKTWKIDELKKQGFTSVAVHIKLEACEINDGYQWIRIFMGHTNGTIKSGPSGYKTGSLTGEIRYEHGSGTKDTSWKTYEFEWIFEIDDLCYNDIRIYEYGTGNDDDDFYTKNVVVTVTCTK